jgi:glutathione S-transferase
MARQKSVVDRALDDLEADIPHKTPAIGTISLACALGYLDFRFGDEPRRDRHRHLAGWYADFARLPGIARTVPVG